MRSTRYDLSLNPRQISFPNPKNKLFQVHNKSATDLILMQFGSDAGHPSDAWEILPGDVYTLDPTAPVESIWLWASVANINNRVILG